MVAATLIFCALGMTGQLVWWHGIGMLAMLAVYIVLTVWHDNRSHDAVAELHIEEAGEFEDVPLRTISIVGIVLTGLFAVVVGAEWLVAGSTSLATQFGVPEEVIGLTVIAIGTSLPELATSLVAAYRGHSDVCVGNVIGSNIFNLFGIAGVTALFAPLPFSDKIIGFDLISLAVATLILVPFMVTGLKINRLEGSVMFTLYAAYIAAQFFGLNGSLI
jgi:cation:H+ antiporter